MNENVNVNIRMLAARSGCPTGVKIAKRIGLHVNTYYERCKNPGSWRLQELQAIAKTFHTTVAWLLDSHNEIGG